MYSLVAQELYVAYFSRPAGSAEMARALQPVELATFDVRLEKRQGPTAAEARRAQIERNGGKR